MSEIALPILQVIGVLMDTRSRLIQISVVSKPLVLISDRQQQYRILYFHPSGIYLGQCSNLTLGGEKKQQSTNTAKEVQQVQFLLKRGSLSNTSVLSQKHSEISYSRNKETKTDKPSLFLCLELVQPAGDHRWDGEVISSCSKLCHLKERIKATALAWIQNNKLCTKLLLTYLIISSNEI